jgi:hypothetical protein
MLKRKEEGTVEEEMLHVTEERRQKWKEERAVEEETLHVTEDMKPKRKEEWIL